MSAYPHNVIVIAPDGDHQTAINMARGLPTSYEAGLSVPLSADGSAPATHWGLCTWAGPEFVAWITGAVSPPVTKPAEEWSDPDTPEAYGQGDIDDLLDSLVISITSRDDEAGFPTAPFNREHFEQVLSDEELQMVQAEAA